MSLISAPLLLAVSALDYEGWRQGRSTIEFRPLMACGFNQNNIFPGRDVTIYKVGPDRETLRGRIASVQLKFFKPLPVPVQQKLVQDYGAEVESEVIALINIRIDK